MIIDLISGALSLIRAGKRTVDDVMDDPELRARAKAEENKFRDQIMAETMQGDRYTKRARPTLIYIAAAAMANDLLVYPYVQLINSNFGVVILSDEKFSQLMTLLVALGVARSVLDKQGNWIGKVLDRFK